MKIELRIYFGGCIKKLFVNKYSRSLIFSLQCGENDHGPDGSKTEITDGEIDVRALDRIRHFLCKCSL